MAHMVAHEEETLPIPAAVIGLALVVAMAVVLFAAGWLGCEMLVQNRPFTY